MTDVSIILLKERAIFFPEPVRTLIISEPDILDSIVFIEKLGTWHRLLKMSKTEVKNG